MFSRDHVCNLRKSLSCLSESALRCKIGGPGWVVLTLVGEGLVLRPFRTRIASECYEEGGYGVQSGLSWSVDWRINWPCSRAQGGVVNLSGCLSDRRGSSAGSEGGSAVYFASDGA